MKINRAFKFVQIDKAFLKAMEKRCIGYAKQKAGKGGK
jgi:hypothetical protein